MRRPLRISIYAALLVLLLAIIFGSSGGRNDPLPTPGIRDLIHYYSASVVLLRRQDPYDRDLLREVSASVNRPDTDPVVHWIYPPWVVTSYAPVLIPLGVLPFSVGALFWFAASVLSLLAAGQATWSARSVFRRTGLFRFLPAVLFYLPAYHCLRFGQLSLFMTFALALAMRSMDRKKDVQAGIWFVGAAAKPTVWYLAGAVVAWLAARGRRWKLLLSFICTLAVCTLAAETWIPGLSRSWIASIQYSAGHAQNFRNPTLVDFVTNCVFRMSGYVPAWPAFVIPGAALLLTAFWLVAHRRSSTDVYGVLCPALMVSCFTAPYGWFFDQSALVIAQVMLVALAFKESVPIKLRRQVLCAVYGLQAITALLSVSLFKEQFEFWWFPLPLLAIWLWFYPRLKNENSASPADR